MKIIIKSIEKSGFKPGEDISICLDVAANELKESKTIDYYSELISKYPIKSIEDPFPEDDWKSWAKLTKNTKIQIVGDDLFATNIKRLEKGIKEKSANTILVKLNQIGTITETLDVIRLAHKNSFKTIDFGRIYPNRTHTHIYIYIYIYIISRWQTHTVDK